ncbi:hypothetical protein BCEP27_31194 [Burkholderia cepacia]
MKRPVYDARYTGLATTSASAVSIARICASRSAGTCARVSAPASRLPISPSSISRVSIGSAAPSAATIASVSASVRDGRCRPPDIATTLIALLIGCIPIVESGADAPATSWVSKERAISTKAMKIDRLHDEMHRDRRPVVAHPPIDTR